MAKKAATAELDTDEVADEAQTEATEEKANKKAKKEQPERVGVTTKEAAATLGITPVKLRRILRAMEAFNDKTYTRYDLTEANLDEVKAFMAANADSGTKRGRKGKKNAPEEADAENVEEVMADLENSDDEDLESLDLDDDEDDE